MKLLTKAVLKQLPPLYSQDGKGENAIAVVKFFNPTGAGTWYASEGSPICPVHDAYDCTICPIDTWTDFLFFGVIDLLERELGYFKLSELSNFKGRMGLGIERDMSFDPTPLKNLNL